MLRASVNDRAVRQMQSKIRHPVPTRHLSVGSFREARQIIRLRIQLRRHYTKALGDIGRSLGDAPHFYRGHAQERDGELLRSG